CRGVTFRARAPAPVVIFPFTANSSTPGRRASFRLIVRVSHVSMGGHFYCTVRGGHFHRPTAPATGILDRIAWTPYAAGPCTHGTRARRAFSVTTLAPVCPAAPCRSANQTNQGPRADGIRRSWPLCFLGPGPGAGPPRGERR